ncbi:MAG: efflux RND transporter permease subunit, partial [Calditrichaeota bacterium]|nr:efflux RND transporter permease subunit [Calditrichota bacterium]
MKLDRLLPELSLRRPITVLMIFIAMLVTGMVALQRVPLEMMPSGFKSPWMGFWVPYPNSTPEEIEELIARPFEEQLRTVAGIEYLESYSQSHGVWFFIQLRNGVNTDLAWNQLRDRLDRALIEVDLDIEKVRLRRMGMGESIFFMGVSTEMELSEAHWLADELLRKPLEQIDGVAKVDFWGGDAQELLIDLDLESLGRHRIGAREVVMRLQQENFALGNGEITEGSRRLTVRSDAIWRTVEEVADIPLRQDGLRLRDVAHVHIDAPEKTWTMRVDGNQGLMLSVAKESTANTEHICRDVDALLNKAMKDPRLEGLKVSKLFSQGDFIRESIDNLKESAIWGGIFSTLVIFFFMRRWRMTFLITAAIPFSIFVTVMVIYFAGWSLNIITMMGLMLSVGMVVDNAIVVMESIQSQREHSSDPATASIEGAAEVSLAVTVATLTTVVVFLPLMLISNNAGFSFYMTRIGMPVVSSLLASLLVALLFLPQLVSRARLFHEIKESRLISWSNRKVVALLDRCLRHRFDTGLVLLLIFALIAIPQKLVPSSGEGDGNVNNFELNVQMPVSYSFEDADALFKRLEARFEEQREHYNIKTVTARHSNTWGNIEVFLNSDVQRSWYGHAAYSLLETVGLYKRGTLNREEVIEDVKKNLPTVPGVEMNIGWGNDGQDENAITLSINGQDTNMLRSLADEARRRMEGLPQIVSTELDVDQGDQELRLVTDRQAMDRSGVSASALAGTVRYALSGAQLPDLRQGGRELDAVVRLEEGDRDQLSKLKNLTVGSLNGRQVPMGELMDVEHRTAMGTIRRSQGKSFMRIKIATDSKDNDALTQSIRSIMEGMNFPPGYDWSFGRFADRLQEQQNSQQLAMILALCFVFLLMGVLFESFMLPLTILASIPFAIWGAQWALLITGSSFDLMAGIGMVILVGIVVNNA